MHAEVIALFLGLASAPNTPPSTIAQGLAVQVASRDVTIKGVYLGAPEQLVRTNLGSPRELTSGAGELSCEMGLDRQGFEKTYRYDGLVVHVCRTTEDRTFHVFHWVATGRDWVVSKGVGVGSSQSEIVKQLGQHEPAWKDKDGLTVINYGLLGTDGLLWFKLRDGIVVEMGMQEDWS